MYRAGSLGILKIVLDPIREISVNIGVSKQYSCSRMASLISRGRAMSAWALTCSFLAMASWPDSSSASRASSASRLESALRFLAQSQPQHTQIRKHCTYLAFLTAPPSSLSLMYSISALIRAIWLKSTSAKVRDVSGLEASSSNSLNIARKSA